LLTEAIQIGGSSRHAFFLCMEPIVKPETMTGPEGKLKMSTISIPTLVRLPASAAAMHRMSAWLARIGGGRPESVPREAPPLLEAYARAARFMVHR